MNLSALERRHVNPVPESAGHGTSWRQGPFWFLGNFHPLTVAIAFLGPAVGLSGLWTSVAGVGGILFGAIFMAAHAPQGPSLGLPQMVQSRAQFGYRGVTVPLFATTFTFVGFNVIIVVVLKQGLHQILGWGATPVALGASAVATLLAIYGHDVIHRIVVAIFWISLPLWLVLTFGVVSGRAHVHGPLVGGFNLAGFFAMFAVAASYNITYAPCVSDYTRYLARDTARRPLVAAVFAGAAGAPIWLIPLGAWMATRLGVTDALTGIYLSGNATLPHLGVALVVVSAAALVATMSISAYSAMLSVLTVVDGLRKVRDGARVRVVTVVAIALTWFVVAEVLTNATTVLNNALLFMLYLLAPWTSINLVDFYWVRRGRYVVADLTEPGGIYGNVGVRALAAYALGLALEVPFVSLNHLYQSPGATWLAGVDVSWMVGLVVAGASYWLLTRHTDVEGELRRAARSRVNAVVDA